MMKRIRQRQLAFLGHVMRRGAGNNGPGKKGPGKKGPVKTVQVKEKKSLENVAVTGGRIEPIE